MSHHRTRLFDRREALQGLGIAGIAVLLDGWLVPHRTHARPTSSTEAIDPAVRVFLGPLVPGVSIDRWRILDVRGRYLGGIAVVLTTRQGTVFQLDVLRRTENGPPGIADTPSLSVYLLNRGNGRTATPEEQGLGAMALARALARRESEGIPVPTLLSLPERLARFPAGRFDVIA